MDRLDAFKIHVLLRSMSVVVREQYGDFKVKELVGLQGVSTMCDGQTLMSTDKKQKA